MKIIVTGGCGFIGSHIVDRLINDGNEVIVIDDESSVVNEQFYYNDKATYHKIDIADYDKVRPIFDNVDYVYHLAAKSRVQLTIQNPLKTIHTNSYGTAVLLECSREANVKRFIYSSTSSAYGLKNLSPLNEEMHPDCLSPYSVGKVSGEMLCKVYSDLYNLKTVIFRYFNVYGPREPLRGQYAPVIGLFLKKHINNEPLTIIGDGKQRRDFTHVNDAVEANILAMTADLKDQYGTVFNIGSGKNYSILELTEMISNNVEYLPPRPAEAQITLADNSKARKYLNWNPKMDLQQYIKENV